MLRGIIHVAKLQMYLLNLSPVRELADHKRLVFEIPFATLHSVS